MLSTRSAATQRKCLLRLMFQSLAHFFAVGAFGLRPRKCSSSRGMISTKFQGR